MKKWSAICSLWKENSSSGFLLLELQAEMFLLLLLLPIIISGMAMSWQSWERLQGEAELRDAGRYILNRLEKDICLNAEIVTIKKNNAGNSKFIELQTMERKRVIRVYWEKQRLYRKILTTAGSGNNPLYINDILVEQWQVEKADAKNLVLSFDLHKGKHSQSFRQLMHCYNGVVENGY